MAMAMAMAIIRLATPAINLPTTTDAAWKVRARRLLRRQIGERLNIARDVRGAESDTWEAGRTVRV